jgi:alpha-tubulin suppressor-like RCC1 family protein
MPLAAGVGWRTVTAGAAAFAGIKADGSLWTWAATGSPALGRGPAASGSSPARVGTDTWQQVSATAGGLVALRSDGTLWAWGSNRYGQIDLTMVDSYTPVQVGASADRWRFVATAFATSYAIRTDGTLWAWGYNGNGEVTGTNGFDPLPMTQIGSATTWTTVAAGTGVLAGTQTDTSIWAWGRMYRTDPVTGTLGPLRTPLQIAGSGWVGAAVTLQGVLALRN